MDTQKKCSVHRQILKCQVSQCGRVLERGIGIGLEDQSWLGPESLGEKACSTPERLSRVMLSKILSSFILETTLTAIVNHFLFFNDN